MTCFDPVSLRTALSDPTAFSRRGLISAMGRKWAMALSLLDPCPDLRLAAHVSNQASAGNDCILVLDRAGPSENAIDVRDKHLALPHLWAHFAELTEQFRADEVWRAATCGIRLCLRIGPNYRPTPCLAAWMNADVNAVLGVAQDQVRADFLGEGGGG